MVWGQVSLCCQDTGGKTAAAKTALQYYEIELVWTFDHFGANLLTQHVDGHSFTIFLVAPIGPAITAWRAF